MIISRGRRYIFVHIPKTGGTSLAQALEGRAMKDDILIGDTPKAQRRKARLRDLNAKGRLWKHSTLDDIQGILTPEEMSDMFVLTLVRNPWDRMVSYYHWLRVQRFEHPAVKLAKASTFEGFVRSEHTRRTFGASPYASYVTDHDGNERCSLFARLEHLESDLEPFWEHLGFGLDLPHLNKSDRLDDHHAYYTDELVEIVSEICAKDVARFDYTY